LRDKMPRRYAANTFVIRILETFLFDQIALTDFNVPERIALALAM